MKIKNILAVLLAAMVFTACSTSKVEQKSSEIKGDKLTQVEAVREVYQEEEIIDFNDPNFDIKNVEYDSCCK